MPHLLPPLRLTGATILRDGRLQCRSLALAEGRITRGPLPEIDMTGYLILPGIVDLCGALPGSSPREALTSADRLAARAGVTTSFLSQGWSWEGGRRGPERALAVMAALEAIRPKTLTDLRLQLRVESHLVDGADRLIAAVERHCLPFVMFSNSTEEVQEMHCLRPADFARRAADLGQEPDLLRQAVEGAQARAREVPRHLCTLADAFDRLGVLYGSRADPDGETRERFSMIGARIAEAPVDRRAAAAAHAMMSPVLLEAPAILSDAPTCDLVRQGFCTALVSASDPATLAAAAWALLDRGVTDLPRAWAMISAAPAEILRLPDRGRLDPGLRADLVAVNAASRQIEAVIVRGRLVSVTGEAVRRFRIASRSQSIAAE